MEGALLLDVVVRKSPSIFQLLPGEDEPLLVRGNSLLVLNNKHEFQLKWEWSEIKYYLDFGLDILDGIAWLHLQGDGLPSESLHKDLHLGLMIGRGSPLISIAW